MNARPNTVIRYVANHDIEPYGVFRRSPLHPIFNPYFMNYGYNKIEFFDRIGFYHREYGVIM